MTSRPISRQQLLDLGGHGLRVELDRSDRRLLHDAVARPSMTMRLYLDRDGAKRTYDGWMSPDLVVLHPEGDPTEPLPAVFGAAAMLPSLVAELVGLGIRADASNAQALVERNELAASLRDATELDGLGQVVAVWTLQWHVGGSEPDGMTVVDCGAQHPIWLARSVDGDRLVIEDRGALAIWTRLGEAMGAGTTAARPEPASNAG